MGYPWAIIVNYDFETKNWVACVGPYGTQGKTLHELLLSTHNMLTALLKTVDERNIPDQFPLFEEETRVFRREVFGPEESS